MPWWLTNLVQWPLSKLTAWKSTKVCYKNTDSQASPLKILIKYIYFYFQSSLVIPVCSHVGKHRPKEYRPNPFTLHMKSTIFWFYQLLSPHFLSLPHPTLHSGLPVSFCAMSYTRKAFPHWMVWGKHSLFHELSLDIPYTNIFSVFFLSSSCPLYLPPAT